MARLEAGQPAPDFTLEAHDGSMVSLADLAGATVVLYFYPKDDTSGCTAEACEFRDLAPEYDAAGARIVGVSPDPVTSHVRFREVHGLPFTLLSDPDHAVAEAYGVWVEKSMYGRRYMGVERSTFVIGPDGILTDALYKVRPKGHAGSVLGLVTSSASPVP
jgi:thioredoxin-dependent peroxiredoxin